MNGIIILKKYFQSFGILSDDDIEDLVKNVLSQTLNKGEYFLKHGDTSKHVGFIVTGMLRSFYLSANGEDVTYCITFPNNMITSYAS